MLADPEKKMKPFSVCLRYKIIRKISLSSLGHITLGSLQRIQLKGVLFDFLFDVSGKIAGSFGPLDGRLTIGLAVSTGRELHHSITPFAGLDDGIASPAIVGAAVLLHEDTLCPRLNRLTNHGNQPPFS